MRLRRFQCPVCLCLHTVATKNVFRVHDRRSHPHTVPCDGSGTAVAHAVLTAASQYEAYIEQRGALLDTRYTTENSFLRATEQLAYHRREVARWEAALATEHTARNMSLAVLAAFDAAHPAPKAPR